MTGNGRFAPSPTGPLHVGNLRTALASWLMGRAGGHGWIVRMEDLDPVTSGREHAAVQLQALAALGLVPDGEVLFQSERFDLYRAAIDELGAAGLVYECFCTRREILDATRGPHAVDGSDDVLRLEGGYPGTCRDLARATRRRFETQGRRPAMRLRGDGRPVAFDDLIAGHVVAEVDDVVLQRNDGVPAYNLAVVIDDAAQQVTQVVRGDDLASSTPRQIALQRLLGLPTPAYAHVPLVVGDDGVRIAKRHGAVTLTDLAATGLTVGDVLARLGASLGLCAPTEAVTVTELLARFTVEQLPRRPCRLDELLADLPPDLLGDAPSPACGGV